MATAIHKITPAHDSTPARQSADRSLTDLSPEKHFAPDIERQVLGLLLWNPSSREAAFELLDAKCFADSSCLPVFEAMQELYDTTGKFNAVTLVAEVRRRGEMPFVQALARDLTAPADLSFVAEYCELLQDWRRRRELLSAIQEAAFVAMDYQSDPTTVQEMLEARLHVAATGDTTDDVRDIRIVVRDVIGNILNPDTRPLLSTGYTNLDSIIGGMRPEELIIIGGRPGQGKSALGLSIAHNVGFTQNIPTVFFSYEMARQQIWNREIGWLSKIDHRRFERQEALTEWERDKVKAAGTMLLERSLFIEARPGPTVAQFRARIRRLIDSNGIRLVVIDQTNKLKAEMKNRQKRDELSYITDALKNLAKELAIPIIALHQLNRESEKVGSYNRPSMSGFKDSGSFEEDADSVWLCYRAESYGHSYIYDSNGNEIEASTGKGDVQVEKARNSDPAICRLAYIKQNARWEALSMYDTLYTSG